MSPEAKKDVWNWIGGIVLVCSAVASLLWKMESDKSEALNVIYEIERRWQTTIAGPIATVEATLPDIKSDTERIVGEYYRHVADPEIHHSLGKRVDRIESDVQEINRKLRGEG